MGSDTSSNGIEAKEVVDGEANLSDSNGNHVPDANHIPSSDANQISRSDSSHIPSSRSPTSSANNDLPIQNNPTNEENDLSPPSNLSDDPTTQDENAPLPAQSQKADDHENESNSSVEHHNDQQAEFLTSEPSSSSPPAPVSSSPNSDPNMNDDDREDDHDDIVDDAETPNQDIITTKTPRRVKVYLLQGEDWLDRGTGYCTGRILSHNSKPQFIVHNELNPKDVILRSFLEGSIQYQRQQETLIVWTDLSGKDLALSFQETEGCAELCDFIIKVQKRGYSPDISLYYVFPNAGGPEKDGTGAGTHDITELITGPITYPEEPNLTNLSAVFETINQGSNSQYTRSCISKFIVENDYFSKLINVFHQSEKQKNLQNLFTLTEIIKYLILYNEPSLIEEFLATETKILGLVGILEYDSEYPNFKACHREFLADKSKFKTVIHFPDLDTEKGESSINIFKKDFHLNFLKNVVLARYLDDQTFNTLNSLIYFNQVEIINSLKSPTRSNNFCTRLFSIYDHEKNDNDHFDATINNVSQGSSIVEEEKSVLKNGPKVNNNSINYNESNGITNKNASSHPNLITSPNSSVHTGTESNHDTPNTPVSPHSDTGSPSKFESRASLETKRNGVKMLHQYVLISKSLQSYQKSEFFAILVKSGLFKMISFALKDTDSNIRVLGTELIVIIIEQDVSLVNSIDKDEGSIDIMDPPAMTPAAAAAAAVTTSTTRTALNSQSEKASNAFSVDKDETLIEGKPLKLKLSDDMTLSLILSKLLLEDKNPGLKIQAYEALRILLDSNIASNTTVPGQLGHGGESDLENSRSNSRSNGGEEGFELDVLKNEFNRLPNNVDGDDVGDDHGNQNLLHKISTEASDINTNNYFQAFYSQVAPNLFKDLVELTKAETHSSKQEGLICKIRNDEILYQHLCDLISFCSREHESYISRPFFLENNILLGVCKILTVEVKITLKLSAIRCLKNILLLNDSFYARYIINNNLLEYFFQFFESVIDENNLANSSCLDLLQVIIKNCDKTVNHGKRHNFKLLAGYIYGNFKDICRDQITYVNTGKELINMVENDFYEDTTKQFGIHDTSFDSEDDEFLNNNAHIVSTPIKSDEEPNESIENEDNSAIKKSTSQEYVHATNGPRSSGDDKGPQYLFEDIEKDMDHLKKANSKRNREELDDKDELEEERENKKESIDPAASDHDASVSSPLSPHSTD